MIIKLIYHDFLGDKKIKMPDSYNNPLLDKIREPAKLKEIDDFDYWKLWILIAVILVILIIIAIVIYYICKINS